MFPGLLEISACVKNPNLVNDRFPLEKKLFLYRQNWGLARTAGDPSGLRGANTIKSRIIEPCAMSSDFPLSVRSRNFFFCLSKGKGVVFLLCFFAPIPEKGISDFIS